MAKGVAQTKVIDRGANRIIREMRKLEKQPYVKTGYLESSGGHRDSSLSVAEIATVHEFGAPSRGIPERSHVRTAFDENLDAFSKITEEQKDEVIFRGKSTDKALGTIGQAIKGAIQKKITDGDSSWPPLAESTVAAKGSDKPLIDTGQMRSSVNYEVVNKS